MGFASRVQAGLYITDGLPSSRHFTLTAYLGLIRLSNQGNRSPLLAESRQAGLYITDGLPLSGHFTLTSCLG